MRKSIKIKNMKLINGDSLEVLKGLEDNSVDSIVSDPPYGISFMGKKWDYDVPSVELWEEVYRVLKPGGHCLIACGTRTQHRMAVNLEDAGFEIRDIVAWVYGSGFPKSLNIGKVADKYLKTGNASWNGTGDSSNGALGYSKLQHNQEYRPEDYSNRHQNKEQITEEEAKKWQGWGTALKPSMELWTLCRKPLSESTVAENVLKYGTGGINIDGCRVESMPRKTGTKPTSDEATGSGNSLQGSSKNRQAEYDELNLGRFPANLIHDGSDEVVELFPETKSGKLTNDNTKGNIDNKSIFGGGNTFTHKGYEADSGSASRFFYCAKASKSERNKGLEGFEEVAKNNRKDGGKSIVEVSNAKSQNFHPTVKPIKLMQYLCRLITPAGGTVLDPFMGSGSTGIGAKLEGFDFIGIEREEKYVKIAEARINAYKPINKLL